MRKVAILLLAAIIICSGLIACNGKTESVTKPTIGNIPEGWYLSDQDAYGSYEEDDGTKWGLIEYTDEIDDDFVQVYWGDVPRELKGKETNRDALIDRAILESYFIPTETGNMTIGGHVAGYTRAYDADLYIYDMEIVFVIGATCIDIYAMFDATEADEEQVMSLINSIR